MKRLPPPRPQNNAFKIMHDLDDMSTLSQIKRIESQIARKSRNLTVNGHCLTTFLAHVIILNFILKSCVHQQA